MEKNYFESFDGVKIGYRSIGNGPGLILVHGGLQSSLNFTRLAGNLSRYFTVHVPDRRGRGLSPDAGVDAGLETQARDLTGLLHFTHANFVFGLSAGAVVSLQAALMEERITKLALYEPPLLMDEAILKRLDRDYLTAMRHSNYAKAFLSILKATGDRELSAFTILPGFIVAPLINRMMKSQMEKKNPDEIPLQELVKTFGADQEIVRQSASLIEQSKMLKADTLLLSGTRSQAYLKNSVDILQTTIKRTRAVVFKKLGHLGADDTEHPELVAEKLIRFFGDRD